MNPWVVTFGVPFIVDALALGFFVSWYYRIGVTIVRRKFSLRYPAKKAFSVGALAKRWGKEEAWGAALVFRRLDDRTIAFRMPYRIMVLPRIQNVMGGTIRSNPEERTVEVRCFVGFWWLALTLTLPFIAAWHAFEGRFRDSIGTSVLALVVGLGSWLVFGFCRDVAAKLEVDLGRS